MGFGVDRGPVNGPVLQRRTESITIIGQTYLSHVVDVVAV